MADSKRVQRFKHSVLALFLKHDLHLEEDSCGYLGVYDGVGDSLEKTNWFLSAEDKTTDKEGE